MAHFLSKLCSSPNWVKSSLSPYLCPGPTFNIHVWTFCQEGLSHWKTNKICGYIKFNILEARPGTILSWLSTLLTIPPSNLWVSEIRFHKFRKRKKGLLLFSPLTMGNVNILLWISWLMWIITNNKDTSHQVSKLFYQPGRHCNDFNILWNSQIHNSTRQTIFDCEK